MSGFGDVTFIKEEVTTINDFKALVFEFDSEIQNLDDLSKIYMQKVVEPSKDFCSFLGRCKFFIFIIFYFLVILYEPFAVL